MVFSQNELIIMIGVVSVLLLCITILTILDIREYLKSKNGMILEDEEDFKEVYQEDVIKPEPVQVVLEEEKAPEEIKVTLDEVHNNEELFFEEMEDEKFDIKEEKEPVIQEIKEEVVPQIMEVKEEIIEKETPKKEKKKLEIFEDLDELEEKLPNKLDDVTNFEMEQERTAIISLDELLKKSDELYNDNEFVQYDDGNEPITIDEVISRFRKESEPVTKEIKEDIEDLPLVMQEIEKEDVMPYSKKETIPFISSVYGIEKENNALEFENQANNEKLYL